jgi:hypothetical protein
LGDPWGKIPLFSLLEKGDERGFYVFQKAKMLQMFKNTKQRKEFRISGLVLRIWDPFPWKFCFRNAYNLITNQSIIVWTLKTKPFVLRLI